MMLFAQLIWSANFRYSFGFTYSSILKLVLVKLLNYGPDHVQLTLLNRETEIFLALNKELKVNWKFQFFI